MRSTIALFLLLLPLSAQVRSDRYALILADAPVAELVSSRAELRSAAAQDHRSKIEGAQATMRSQLKSRGVRVIGAINTLLNAVFVAVPEGTAAASLHLPGVVEVVPMQPIRMHLNRAANVMNVTRGWESAGGEANAGAGVRIGVLDSGIDQTHPAFQQNLPEVAGFPKCRPQDCSFTNRKVIVARSYVEGLVLADEPADSRPDDLTPRDRAGHGTAVAMIAAGARTTAPAATITGVAPAAYLGNYKIFGSPGVNDLTFDNVVLQALDDAFNDGMDIVTLSIGSPALWGPLDSGNTCGRTDGGPCDRRAAAVDSAVSRGMTVVVSAGNDADLGIEIPTLNSIHSPATAPRAISVGASTNAQQLFHSVRVTGDAPSNLQRIRGLFGNGPKPGAPFTAPIRDVAKLDNDGLACEPLTNGSLNGSIALIQRGDCSFAVKINNAQRAGAAGAILYQLEGSNFLFPIQGLEETGIPAVLIGNTDGKALKSFIDSRPDRPVTLDPALQPVDANANEVSFFSSLGPSIGNSAIKPEVMAVGTSVYTATQRYDPNGQQYDASGYTVVQGTSFAVPFVAGASALVKQRTRNFVPAQIKSAVVNTASDNITDFDADGNPFPARVWAIGGGQLDVGAAVQTNVTVDPATVSFGASSTGTFNEQVIRVINSGSSTVTLNFSVQARDSNSRVTVTPSTLALPVGVPQEIRVRPDGGARQAGSYEGVIIAQGGNARLRIPYLFLVGNGVPFNLVPLRGFDFDGVIGFAVPGGIGLKVIDRFGVPVRNVPVRFRAVTGGGSIESANANTDDYGIAEARAILGEQLGEQVFEAEVSGVRQTLQFFGVARLLPAIESNGVVNAASGRIDRGLAPGSYVSIFGRGLSPATRVFNTPYLPLSLAGVSVSFDAPQGGQSFPGRLHFVSDGQINVQIPWELQGMTSVLMKVSINSFSSQLYTVPLAPHSPGIFEYTEASSGRIFAAGLDQGFRVVGTENPIARGRVLQLYVNGLGAVDNQPASGEPASDQRLAPTRTAPTVTIGGRNAEVQFSGLAPSFVGLYQVNVRVADDTPTGIQPVVVTMGEASSKPVNTVVQ